MELTLHRVTEPATPAFEALVGLYQAAHPASERKSLDLISAMVLRPEYLFLTVQLDGAVVGFAIVNVFPDSDAAVLEYLAIAEERRGQRIGQFLFRQIAERHELDGRFLLVEVDSDKLTAPSQEECTRRKRFYRNLGCREVGGLDYIMPPVSSEAPPAMDIMVYRRSLPETIARTQLREWLQGIYVHEYLLTATDSRIDGMLDNCLEGFALV